MNVVSRSFAAVTPCFEEPLDTFMSTAYLICRVADNIEDCKQPLSWQKERFNELKKLLNIPATASDTLAIWSSQDWIGLDIHQKRLMQTADGLMLWQIYELIPENYRTVISRWVTTMASGMEEILDPEQKPLLSQINGVTILETVDDYNTYCYIVAGTVGRMGTELAINHYQLDAEKSQILLTGSETCGRALQKTNIIKDFLEDFQQGKCYLPNAWLQEIAAAPLQLQGAPQYWIQKVLLNIKTELDETVTYVMSIPYEAAGYRLASLMCLLPAYQTILLAAQQQDDLFTLNHQVKISRSCFSQCFEDAKSMVENNEELIRYSLRINDEIASSFKSLLEI